MKNNYKQALDNQMGNPLEQISNLVKEAKELKGKYGK